MEQQISGSDSLTEEQIEQYLSLNPRFFVGKDRLLKHMRLPHASGKAISLLERQNELLRTETAQLQERLQALTNNARDNDRLFMNLRALVLDLISANDHEAMVQALQHHLCTHFNVDEFRLITASNPSIPNEQVMPDIKILRSQPKAVCGNLDEPQIKTLLGEKAVSQSLAVASIHYQGFVGLLVLGSKDANYFRNSMDTLFLNYLADIVGRVW